MSKEPQRYTLRSEQYLQQARAAEEAMLAHERLLLAQGWVWNSETHQWTNPNIPGASISY